MYQTEEMYDGNEEVDVTLCETILENDDSSWMLHLTQYMIVQGEFYQAMMIFQKCTCLLRIV